MVLPLLALVSPAMAQRIHVDASGSPGGNGASWSTAHTSLATALASATAGAEVWVAHGTYAGSFTIPPGVRVLGGFAPGANRATQRTPAATPTILDGQGTQRVVQLGDGSVLDGVTVRNGFGNGGGGALVDSGSPTIRNVVFTLNRNSGGRGSALAVRSGATPLVSNSVFTRNQGPGHVIDVDGAGGTYDHVTVWNNIENGLHMQNGARCVITDCVFGRNTGRGVCDVGVAIVNVPLLENNLFWQNGVSLFHYRGVEYRDINQVNALSYARQNLSADPRFVDEANGDLRLTSASPAVDAGHVAAAPGFDAFGNPRYQDGNLDGLFAADIGAHEFAQVALRASGTAAPGGSLTFALDGTPGLASVLVFAARPTEGVFLPTLGTVFVDAGTVFVGVALGPLPATTGALSIPAGIPSGTAFVVQGAALSGATGNTSNVLDVLL